MSDTTTITPATAFATLKQLRELSKRRATLADLPPADQARIRGTLDWLGEQHAAQIHNADRVPYALGRVRNNLTFGALGQIMATDMNILETFVTALFPPAVTAGRR